MADVGGDHNVYFLDDDPALYRSRSFYNYGNYQMYHGPDPQINHVEDLFMVLKRDYAAGTVLCIPHWGGRHGNPAWHDPVVQRAIEVFSEHRRSEDWATGFLTRGYRMGIMASSDGHKGNPGYGHLWLKRPVDWNTQETGMALMAVQAEELTRESIFNAIYNRRTYATSGDRIILDFRVNGRPMGSEIQSEEAPGIFLQVIGTDKIEKVEIKRNSRVVKEYFPGADSLEIQWADADFRAGKSSYYYVRILQANGEEAISSPIWVNYPTAGLDGNH
jgi:hypothetical protein